MFSLFFSFDQLFWFFSSWVVCAFMFCERYATVTTFTTHYPTRMYLPFFYTKKKKMRRSMYRFMGTFCISVVYWQYEHSVSVIVLYCYKRSKIVSKFTVSIVYGAVLDFSNSAIDHTHPFIH